MSRRRRRRGGLDLLTALTVLVALDGGDVAVDGFSKWFFFFFFFSFCFCVFLLPSVFFLLFLHPFSVFPFPLLLVPSQSLCFSPRCLCFSIFYLWFVLFFFFPPSLCLSLSLFRLSFLFHLFFLFPLLSACWVGYLYDRGSKSYPTFVQSWRQGRVAAWGGLCAVASAGEYDFPV